MRDQNTVFIVMPANQILGFRMVVKMTVKDTWRGQYTRQNIKLINHSSVLILCMQSADLMKYCSNHAWATKYTMSASTLEAICTVKMDMQNRKTSCYDGTYTREETKAAKKATMKFSAKK